VKFGVVVFPGSNCDMDAHWAVGEAVGAKVSYIWHDQRDLDGADCLIIPGGFTYGDYLRTGAIARFSPIMSSVIEFAQSGRPVIGICNGFQILCEAGLLPGALTRNIGLRFICKFVHLRVESTRSPFTNQCQVGDVLKIPIAHNEGNYYCDPETHARLVADDRILVRYSTPGGEITPEANPNGSLDNIAGICNDRRNVFGLMPHPERASEIILGSADGRRIFESILNGA
jgi:phosphoribosylformylglycinamidine synthase I